MSAPFTRVERRVAWFLFVVALTGTVWHFFMGLRPPPPPLEIEREAFGPDADNALCDSSSAIVSYEVGYDAGLGLPLDLGSAEVSELTALPGIGPVLAGRIIAWRSSRSGAWLLDDLLEIRGIGPATVDRIRSLVTVPEVSPLDTSRGVENDPPGRQPNGPGRLGEWR
jgi:hypothetical protein